MKKLMLATALSLAAMLLCAFSVPQLGATQNSPEFNHQTIHVRDIHKSATFYETIVGLKRMPDPFKDDLHVFFRMGDHAELHIVAGATQSATSPISVHLALSVASVEAFAARLDRSQVRYVNAREEERKTTVRPDGVKQIYFQDPDGYWLEVNDAGSARRK